MILFSGECVDGIEYDVRVDMLTIRVDADHSLISRQMLPHKFLCDLQRQFRCDFAGTEGLDDVIELHTVRLVPALLDRHHVMAGRCRKAALRRREDLFLRLISIENIRNGLLEAAAAGEDLCNSHY